MRAKNVELKPCENQNQIASTFGKRFANAGGVTAAVLQSMKEANADVDVKVHKANGAAECKKALLLMRAANFRLTLSKEWHVKEDVWEDRAHIMISFLLKKSRDSLISQADDKGIHENLSHYQMDSFSMHRE